MSGITFVEPISVNTAAAFTFANTSVTSTVTAGTLKTDTILYANGQPYQFVTVAGANTQLQFNNGSGFGASANLTFSTATNTLSVTNITSSGVLNFASSTNVALGNISNVHITGGSSGQLLSTDGAGNLSWSTVSTTGITSGNSNVNIPTANGNITVSVGGVSNVIVATTTGIVVTGNIDASNNTITAGTGNVSAGNANLGNLVTANFFSGNGSLLSGIAGANITGTAANANYAVYAGTVLTAAQPNITSVGNLTSLTVTGNILAANLISVSNTGADFNIVGATQATSNGLGGSIAIASGEGNGTGRGGLLTLNAGNAGTSGNAAGGNISIAAGYGYGLGQGGQVGIYAGLSGNTTGGKGSNIVFAGGTFGGTAGGVTLTAGTAGGTDKAGGSITIAGGAGTGAGTPGAIIIKAAPALTTGTTVQTAANVLVITGAGANLTGALDVSGNLTAGNLIGKLANGNSNINIPSANGNVTVSVGGTANVLVATTSGLSVIGNGNITLSGSASQISGANVLSASYLTGTLTTAAQTNITSVGTLTSLTVGPNSSISLSGTTGYLKANSIFGLDGTAAIYPYYGATAGAVGIVTNLTVGTGGTGNLVVNGNITGTVITGSQPNITSVGTLAGLTANSTVSFINASNVSLGNVANIHITGGTSGYVLTTDGAGNLSWAETAGGTTISNGTSNVDIAASNGNVTIGVGGTANVAVFTTAGANIAGNLTAGNLTAGSGTGGNITGANIISANLFTGTLTTAAQPNITSLGTLSSLTVGGYTSFKTSQDALSVITGATGTITHDTSAGAIFYHTSPAANFTPNFINVPTTDNYSTVVILLIAQGSTPYMPTATGSVQINGSNVSVKWLGGQAPAGAGSAVNMVSFSLLRTSGSWSVLGQGGSFS